MVGQKLKMDDIDNAIVTAARLAAVHHLTSKCHHGSGFGLSESSAINFAYLASSYRQPLPSAQRREAGRPAINPLGPQGMDGS